MWYHCIELLSDLNFLSILSSTPLHQIDVLPGHLEVLEELDEEEDEYTKQKHAARKRQMTAGRSSPDKVHRAAIIWAMIIYSNLDSAIGAGPKIRVLSNLY